MPEPFVYDQYLSRLDRLDGMTIGAALVTASYVPATTDTTVNAITGEVSGGSYARQTFEAEYVDNVDRIVDADEWPSFDLVGTAAAHVGVVTYVADSGDGDYLKLISFIPYATQPQINGWLFEPINGFARATSAAGVLDRLAAVETAVVPLDTSAATEGYVLTVGTPGEPAAFAFASGGGGGADLPISSDDVDVPDAGDLTSVLTSVFATANAARDAIAADAWLQPVRAVATSTVNLAVGGLLTVDGVTVAAGDLVLLTGQTSPIENRVAVAAVGTWTLTAVANAAYVAGTHVAVTEGTTHAGSLWRITTPDPIVVGVDDITWTEFTGGGAALSDDDPADLGTADPGTSPDASRSDHVHDLPTAAAVGAVASTEKGVALGVADLDASGLIPAALLPSYVDDVLSYANLAAFPGTGATGTIYVAEDTNLTYRWSGSAYVEISASLALGTTSSTAHRGDQGAAAYTHSQVTSGNPHGVTKTDVSLANVTNDAQVKLSTVTTKGDLYAATGSGAVARLAAGTDGYRLVADSAQTTGLNWQAPATTPWQRRINLPGWSQPDTVSGTWSLATQTGASGVVATSTAATTTTSWTWTDLPTGSGTWALDVIVRGVSNGGIITATIGGVAAGTFDCYAASTTVNTLLTTTGIVLSTDARRDLVFTAATKNASSTNYQINVQAIVLRRTGA